MFLINWLKGLFRKTRSEKELWLLVKKHYKDQWDYDYLCPVVRRMARFGDITNKEFYILQEILKRELSGWGTLDYAYWYTEKWPVCLKFPVGDEITEIEKRFRARRFRNWWMNQQIKRCEHEQSSLLPKAHTQQQCTGI